MSQLRLVNSIHPDVTATDLAMMERAIVLAGTAAAMDEVPVVLDLIDQVLVLVV